MKRSIVLSLLASLAFSAAALTGAGAQSEPGHFNVQIWNDITHDYPLTGTMDITYHPDGIIRGYYHPAGLPSFVPITGGRDGDRIWLTIGTSGRWTLNGHFHDGRITGSASRSGATTPYSFVATPG